MLGDGGGAWSQPMSTAVHIKWSPNKLWRSTSIFNLCFKSKNDDEQKLPALRQIGLTGGHSRGRAASLRGSSMSRWEQHAQGEQRSWGSSMPDGNSMPREISMHRVMS
jgi:hypothetical protein